MSERRALLVEDIVEIAEHTSACLRGDGWRVDVCHDGLKAGISKRLIGRV